MSSVLPQAAKATDGAFPPIFSFSSILLMYFYYRSHPLLRWKGDVDLPSTGVGGVDVTSNPPAIKPPTCGAELRVNGHAGATSPWEVGVLRGSSAAVPVFLVDVGFEGILLTSAERNKDRKKAARLRGKCCVLKSPDTFWT